MNLLRFATTTLLFLCGNYPAFCADDSLAAFLGEAVFEKQRLFDDQRYPNVVVSTRGTVLSVWGNDGVVVRRSCLLYTSPSPRDVEESRMPSSA